MAAIFRSRQTFFTGCYTGRWLYQQDSHEYFRYFELLIDALAEILTEMYQFQNWTYFVTLWRHQWRHDMRLYKCSHNLLIPMHRKVNDDIFARSLVIIKNVILFIKEYWGPTFRPACDVIGDVIIMKNNFYGIIWTIFSYLRSNCCVLYFKIFKMVAILSSQQTFSAEVIPEVEYTKK